MPLPKASRLSNLDDAPLAPLLPNGRMSWEMRNGIWRRAGYHPSPPQLKAHRRLYYDGGEARCVLTQGGEQSGKSLSTAAECLARFPEGRLYWVVAPRYSDAQHEMEYLYKWLVALGWTRPEMCSMPSQGSWELRLRLGIRIKSLSAEDARKISGEAPDGIMLVEAAQCAPEVFSRCLGRTGPRQGWLWVNGTLEGSVNWFAQLKRRWSVPNDEHGIVVTMPSWANEARYPGGWQNGEIQRLYRALDREFFLERYAGEPTAPKGLVFPEFDYQYHVRPIVLGPEPEDPNELELARDLRTVYIPETTPVSLAIDPGYAGGYSVLAIAQCSDNVYVLDEIYEQYVYDEDMVAIAQRRPWWGKVQYAVMDIAGKAHHADRSSYDVWSKYLNVHMKPVGIRDGIKRTHVFLKPDPITRVPRMIFDPKCKKTALEHTDLYRYRTDEAGEALSENPIDSGNHSAKAEAYWLVYHYGLVDTDAEYGFVSQSTLPWVRRDRTTRRSTSRR